MNTFQISKYNPEYRTQEGKYLKDDWTSISDIGCTFGGDMLTSDKYIDTENNYIEALNLILYEVKSSYLKIVGLEKHNDKLEKDPLSLYDKESEAVFNNISEGSILSIKDALILIRLILRENLWCYLVNEDITIKVGYDYYVDIITSKKLNSFNTITNKMNLFVIPLNS